MNSQVHHMLDSQSHVTEFADQVETASKGTQMSRQIATQVLAKDKGMQCIEYSMLCNVMSYTLCVCVHIFGTCIIFNVLYNKSDISYLKTSRAFDVLIHSGKPNSVG